MSRLKVTLGALVLAATMPPSALAQAPPGRPGRRPATAPTARSPGTAPPFVPPGTAPPIPAGATGPGCWTRRGRRSTAGRRTFSVPLACQGNGTVRVTARAGGKGTLARAGYRCAGGRATARFTVSRKVAKRLARRRSWPRDAAVKQGGRTTQLDFTLRAAGRRRRRKGSGPTGTCSARRGGRPQAYLVEPDFTAASPIPISTRGWVAWYTAGRRLALARQRRREHRPLERPGRRRVTGVAQFHPNGAAVADAVDLGPDRRARRAAASTPSASTRSSTGSAAGPTTSGSTSTPARRARSPPAAPPSTASYP